MELDQSLISDVPIWNEKIEGFLKQLPVYLRDETLKEHNKKLHRQPGFEINICHEGKAAVVIEQNIHMQYPGDLIVIPGHTPHQIYPDPATNYKRTVICFIEKVRDPDMNDGLPALLDLEWFSGLPLFQLQLQPTVYVEIVHFTRQMYDEFNNQETGWKRMILSKLLGLTVLLQRSIDSHKHALNTSQSASSEELNYPIQACCDYISTHLHENISLQNMAQMLSVSPEHLTRSFKREKGISLYQYVLFQRVAESKRLLQSHPEMTLTDIAFSVGFTSSAQFNRVFKNITQIPPSTYRRQFHP